MYIRKQQGTSGLSSSHICLFDEKSGKAVVGCAVILNHFLCCGNPPTHPHNNCIKMYQLRHFVFNKLYSYMKFYKHDI